MSNMLLMPALTLPAERPSLTDAVVEAVRDGVQHGELVPGEVYSVYQLADLLGVSRSPVREAMLRLAEAGLVEIARNRGFRVVLPTRPRRRGDLRGPPRPRAGRRAPRRRARLPRGPRPGIAARHGRAAAHGDEPAFWAADRALHRAILRRRRQPPRRRASSSSCAPTTALLGPPTTATGRSLAEIHAEHRPVVDAVLAGDPAAAEAAMRAHLEHTCALLTAAAGS